MKAKYILRFDDFYNGMDIKKYYKITNWILKTKIPAIIGVIPAWKDGSTEPLNTSFIKDGLFGSTVEKINPTLFYKRMRELQENGSEIALHGYSHKLHKCKSILNINDFGEFPGLSYEEQRRKIILGKRVFKDNGLACRTFMAPAHSYDENTLTALRSENMKIISDGKAFYPYSKNGLIFIPQISSKFKPFPFGIITICIHPQYMNTEVFIQLRNFASIYRRQIVSIDYAIIYLNSMSPFLKRINAFSPLCYKIYKSF